MNENFVISIGRQLGSGGREIGQKISSILGIPFYDKELIMIASKESGVDEKFFEKADEKRRFSLFGAIFGLKSSSYEDYYSDYYLSNESLFIIQSDVIRKLAIQNSCLFVGRCADYILKDHPRCLNIFVCARMEERIKRVADRQKITIEKAAELIEKTDRHRSEYYSYFSGKVWGAADSYHLCIDSSVLGIEDTAQFICRYAERKFNLA